MLPGSINCLAKAPSPAPGMVDSLISIKLGTGNLDALFVPGRIISSTQGSSAPCSSHSPLTFFLHSQQTGEVLGHSISCIDKLLQKLGKRPTAI